MEKVSLDNVSTNNLMEELLRRKEKHIETINNSIKELNNLGFRIKDSNDKDYELIKIYSDDTEYESNILCELEET